ncbi:MAG: 2-hydroxyacyl-CoA dehydratase family protein [Desulfobacteraceae bacterium]
MSEPEKQKIASAKKMREIMTAYYIETMEASARGKKIAWITSGGPVEPLVAMDILPIYPENHGAMIGASKMGQDFCERAEGMGYSNDLCSYARVDIACAKFKGGPVGGLPAPDMLICCNNICGTVLKWYEIQARYFDVPLFVLDTPVCRTGFTPEIKTYVRNQVNDYIRFLETVTGKKFDHDRMAEAGRLSLEAQQIWQQVLATTARSPSPMSAFDAFFFLALIVTLRGTQTAVDFYGELLEEMHQRVNQGIAAVPGEKYRLLWDNLPIWNELKWLSGKFAGHQACLVADTYTSAWCGSMEYLDGENFLNTMAEGYTRIYLNLGIDEMAEQVIDMVSFYRADGLVMHSNRSCKPYSFGQMDIMEIVRKRCGIPVLMVEADMTDPRSFSKGQMETRIDAFMEIIKQKR